MQNFKTVLSLLTLVYSYSLHAHPIVFNNHVTSKLNNNQRYLLQAGSFSSKTNAERLQQRYAKLGYNVTVKSSKHYSQVLVGPLSPQQLKHVSLSSPRPMPKPSVKVAQPAPRPKPVINRVMVANPPLIAENHWFIEAKGGTFWPNSQNTMVVPNGSDFTYPQNLDTYTVDSPQISGSIGAVAGYRQELNMRYVSAISLGLAYQHLFNQTVGGNIVQYSLAEFNNYTYSWSSSSEVLAAYSKINMFRWGQINPYVDGSLGLAWNKSNSYREQARAGVTPRISPDFSAKTNSQFAYSVGAGVDMRLTERLIGSVGYEYQSLGDLGSGTGVESWSGTYLALADNYNHNLLFGVTYLF